MASLTLDWIQLAAAVGALQGLLLAGVVVAQRTNRTANRLLAALIAAFTIFLASSVYYATGLIRAYPQFFGISYHMPWIFGPLVYLYAVAASDRAWRFEPRHLLHFVPVAISLTVTAPYYMMSGADKIAMYERLVAGDVPTRLMVIDPFKFVSGISYSAATFIYLRNHRRRIEDSYSNTARVNLSWLFWLAVAAAFIWAMATTAQFALAPAAIRDELVTLAIAILVYAIGYMGLRQPEIFRFETAEHRVPVMPPAPLALVAGAEAPAAEPDAPRYERSGLGDDEAVKLEAALLRLMDRDRAWTNSELTLADLAARLGTTPHKLSEVLNGQIGKTFYDFVNGYRVRDVQRRIEAGEARTRKMLALALDAGFASKSTFNQAFKKHTNQTPSDFATALLSRENSE
jgi:AraC-like DNA-binding protein